MHTCGLSPPPPIFLFIQGLAIFVFSVTCVSLCQPLNWHLRCKSSNTVVLFFLSCSASDVLHLSRRLDAAAKTMAQIAVSLESTSDDDIRDFLSQLILCFLAAGETTRVARGLEKVRQRENECVCVCTFTYFVQLLIYSKNTAYVCVCVELGGGGVLMLVCWSKKSSVIECQTCDRKVAGLIPGRSGREFSSPVNFLSWLLFWYLFHPCVSTVAHKRFCHSPRGCCCFIHPKQRSIMEELCPHRWASDVIW